MKKQSAVKKPLDEKKLKTIALEQSKAAEKARAQEASYTKQRIEKDNKLKVAAKAAKDASKAKESTKKAVKAIKSEPVAQN